MKKPTLLIVFVFVLWLQIPSISIVYDKYDILSSRVKIAIVNLNIKHSDIVYAQAVLESRFFTSKLFINNNNMFGMKLARVRPTTAIDADENGYAIYNSWKECLIDYALYQSSYLRGLSHDEYMKKLASSYAEDKDYINKLTRIINNQKQSRGN